MGDAEFLRHEPCPQCGSRDNLARYTDGHAYCFTPGCGYRERREDAPLVEQSKRNRSGGLIEGRFAPLQKRRISEKTCRRYGYKVGSLGGTPVHIAEYVDRSDPTTIVAQSLRTPDKRFPWRGEPERAEPLWGMHLWPSGGGKMVVVTEGCIDALSIAELQDCRWPVVSVRNGAGGAVRDISAALGWLTTFERVVLAFDMDEPGREAAKKCAALLPPGKAYIANLPAKDANEALVRGQAKELIDALWRAEAFRPDGILTVKEIEGLLTPPEAGLPWWDGRLTDLTFGRRPGEVYTLGAGTGCGKTDWLTQQVAFDLAEIKQPVAVFFLEQRPKETVLRIAGKLAGRRFHVPNAGWSREELVEAIEAVREMPLFLYDHFGQADWEVVKGHIRYLHHTAGVRLVYIDHLTAFAAGSTDERTALERLMSEVASLAQELGLCVHLVSHLATPEGKPHEEGGRVLLRHFKGSRAIGFWTHFAFGIERNQQAKSDVERRTAFFRVLKDRYTGGSVGHVLKLLYNPATGRLDPWDDGAEDYGFDVNGEPGEDAEPVEAPF